MPKDPRVRYTHAECVIRPSDWNLRFFHFIHIFAIIFTISFLTKIINGFHSFCELTNIKEINSEIIPQG